MEILCKKQKRKIKFSKISEADWIDSLRYPLITEKATANRLTRKRQYIFIVDPKLNKKIIKLAFEYAFNVKVSKINTLIVGKKKVRRKGLEGYKAKYKKAIITLAPGFELEFFGMEKKNLGI